jgi:hypothetical protein
MDQTKESVSTSATMSPTVFQLTFSRKVTRDELVASLDRMLGMIGCTGCGLNGHEFHFHPERINPQLDKFKSKLLDGRKALVDVDVFDRMDRQF